MEPSTEFPQVPTRATRFPEKEEKKFAWDTVVNFSTFSMIIIFRDNNNVYRKRIFQYYLTT